MTIREKWTSVFRADVNVWRVSSDQLKFLINLLWDLFIVIATLFDRDFMAARRVHEFPRSSTSIIMSHCDLIARLPAAPLTNARSSHNWLPFVRTRLPWNHQQLMRILLSKFFFTKTALLSNAMKKMFSGFCLKTFFSTLLDYALKFQENGSGPEV